MTIDIRSQIFELRELADAVVETAMAQVRADLAGIIKEYDVKYNDALHACADEVRAYACKQMNHLGTTHTTDSIEGFINAQVVRKLVNLSANPEGEILIIAYS